MRPYFKYPINIIVFIFFIVSLLFPIIAFGGDAIAYCMGYHHGFSQPWPTIQIALYVLFVVAFIAFVVDIIVYFILKSKNTNN